MTMIPKTTSVLTGVGFLALMGSAIAAPHSSTSTLTVTASVANSCTVNTTPLAFGDYDPTADVNGTFDLTFSCTANSNTISIDADDGLNPAGGSSDQAPLRRMSDGSGGFLAYSIVHATTPGVEWGTGSPNNVTLTSAAYTPGANGPFPISAKLYATQTDAHPPGSYTDSVVFTINF